MGIFGTVYGWLYKGICLPLAMVLVVLLAACTHVKSLQGEVAESTYTSPRVLLIPPDVILVELTTAGLPLPRADWTGHAERVLFGVLEESIAARGGRLIRYQAPENRALYAPEHVTAVALHNAIVNTLITYRYRQDQLGNQSALPTRAEGLGWTLGESVRPLREDYDADYALFLIYRHISSSPGRALLNTLALVFFGAIQPTSQAVGFVSLVDLHSGQVVWTNLLSSQGLDVNQPAGLAELGRRLVEEVPL